MAQAYRIQDAAIARWRDTLLGWKIGYISADRRGPGDPDRLVGPIWRRDRIRPANLPPPEVGIFTPVSRPSKRELVIRVV